MEVKSTTQLRTEYLARASKIISGPREEEYGSPHQNFGDCAALWTTYLIGKYRGQSLDEVQFHLPRGRGPPQRAAKDRAHLLR